MSTISRRSFLAGSAALGTAGLLAGGGTALAASATRIPLERQQRRVVVIGSGFGGGVAALRLTEAGVPVTLLERGLRWPTGPNATTFPTLSTLDKRVLFYDSIPELFGRKLSLDPYAGLFEAVAGQNMLIMCAAAYGGGSITYQGMTLEPSAAVFESEFPSVLDVDRMHRVHYPRVARMLQIATAPDTIINSPTYEASRVFARNARAAGYEVEKIPMPIDWSFAERELRGEMRPSYTDGSCALGVNNGGKHSIDVTYLAAAEATGRLEVRTLNRVTDVARTPAGTWEVHVDVTDPTGRTVAQTIITTPALVMGAGSAGTTRLLMRAGAKGLIPDLPDELGANWGSNADRIYTWSSLAEDFGATQGGPVVYGSKDWADPATANTVIQASIPPLSLGPLGINTRSTIMVGYGVSTGRGRFVYDAAKDDAVLQWPTDGDKAIQSRIGPRVQAIAGPLSLLGDTTRLVPNTWHPMGGASMGTVCDYEGRVQGQRGLYVLDGALLPGTAAACNPSMTIAAVVERAMDDIVRCDVGTVI